MDKALILQRMSYAIASGAFHSACIADNRVYTWGYNINCSSYGIKASQVEQSVREKKYIVSGQLGHAVDKNNSAPLFFSTAKPVANLPEDVCFTDVACGFAHTVALTSEGSLYTWGLNDEGQLGWTTQQAKSYLYYILAHKKMAFLCPNNIRTSEVKNSRCYKTCVTRTVFTNFL